MAPPAPITKPGAPPLVTAETALTRTAPPPPIGAALAAAAPPAAAGILAAAKEQRTAAQTKKQAPIWSNSRAPTAATRDVSGARRRAEALSEATNRIDLRGESNAAALRLFLVERGLGGYWPRIERLLLDEATDTLDDVNAARVLNFLQSTAASDGRERPAEPMVPRWVHAGAAARGASSCSLRRDALGTSCELQWPAHERRRSFRRPSRGPSSPARTGPTTAAPRRTTLPTVAAT